MGRTVSVAAVAAVTAVVLAACTGSGDTGHTHDASPRKPRQHLTVWTAATGVNDNTKVHGNAEADNVISDFTAATSVDVDMVRVDTADLQKLTEGSKQRTRQPSAAGAIPDVIGALPLPDAHALAAGGLVDTEAIAQVLDDLDRETFQQSALGLAARRGAEVAVPSGASAQLLVYRTDLFAQADLPAPDTLGKLETAARKLDTRGRAGIVLPTAPDEIATIRTFEHLALAGGCRLLDRGKVALETPECVDAFSFYTRLASHGSEGRQDSNTVRAAYLAGDAAIMPASSAVLDDLGGGDAGGAPTCAQCEQDPAFLAKHSGLVTAIRGPDAARPVQYGTTRGWTITTAADTAAARQFVTYMMGRGFLDWLHASSMGELPVRLGTTDSPQKYARAWSALPVGTDNTSLSSIYSPAVLDLVRGSTQDFRRWGRQAGDAALIASMHRELPIAAVLTRVASGSMDPVEAAAQARREVTALQERTHPSPQPTTS